MNKNFYSYFSVLGHTMTKQVAGTRLFLCVVRLSRIVIAVVPDASTTTTTRNHKAKGYIFSLVLRCTRSPPRPSDLDTETSFFYRFFFFFPRTSSWPRVSRVSVNVVTGLTKRPEWIRYGNKCAYNYVRDFLIRSWRARENEGVVRRRHPCVIRVHMRKKKTYFPRENAISFVAATLYHLRVTFVSSLSTITWQFSVLNCIRRRGSAKIWRQPKITRITRWYFCEILDGKIKRRVFWSGKWTR